MGIGLNHSGIQSKFALHSSSSCFGRGAFSGKYVFPCNRDCAAGHWLGDLASFVGLRDVQSKPVIYFITVFADPKLVDSSLYSRSGELGEFSGVLIYFWC